MSKITITIDTPDTLERRDFAFEIDEALNMGFKHDFAMWTIEPKQKTGRWEERELFTNDGWSIDEWQIERCSECNKYLTTPFRYYFFHHNYCPYCGAKMESEE